MAAIEDALAVWTRLGAEVVNVEMPEGANGLREAWFAICAAEAVQRRTWRPTHRVQLSTVRTFEIFLVLARPLLAGPVRGGQ